MDSVAQAWAWIRSCGRGWAWIRAHGAAGAGVDSGAQVWVRHREGLGTSVWVQVRACGCAGGCRFGHAGVGVDLGVRACNARSRSYSVLCSRYKMKIK
jgi:hypothetical protein